MKKHNKQHETAAAAPEAPDQIKKDACALQKLSHSQRKWLAIRKEAGRKIDPDTAEVDWDYAFDEDPYGMYSELPEEARQVGRHYFARSPGSDIWVEFGDLPTATRDALWKKHKARLMFPAELSWITREMFHAS